MPPKSTKTTVRKPMKTALVDVVAGATEPVAGAAVAVPVAAVAGATVAAAAASDTNILDKISRNCSSEEMKYLAGLSLLEQRVCLIAQDHLESSFDLGRSSGFVAWKKNGGGGGSGGGGAAVI